MNNSEKNDIMTLIKKNQNKPRTLGYSGIIDFLIELHQEKNFMQILNYITVLAFHFKL